jgi:nitric oxide reductase NorE protein
MSSGALISIPRTRERSSHLHVPGEAATWVFIFGDLIVFTVFFIKYFVDRQREALLFAESQRSLSLSFGAVNTVLLLTGSLFVALGVHATRAEYHRRATILFTVGMACAAIFLIDKSIEYTHKIVAGIYPTTNDFYNYYFMFTGFHAVHVMIGLAFLGRMRHLVKRAGPESIDLRFIETGASFWHLVDLLWIILFPVLYIVH